MPTWPPSKLRQDNPSFGRAVEHSGAPGVTRPPSRSARSCNKEPALAVFLRYCFADIRYRMVTLARTSIWPGETGVSATAAAREANTGSTRSTIETPPSETSSTSRRLTRRASAMVCALLRASSTACFSACFITQSTITTSVLARHTVAEVYGVIDRPVWAKG